MGKDSGVKFLFAGLLTIVGVVLIALFWRPFFLWVKYHEPRLVSVEDVARNRVPEGALVTVEGVIDPRHHFITGEPGRDAVIEIGLVLDDDKPMGQWRDNIVRDTRALYDHADPAGIEALESRDIGKFYEATDDYGRKWGSKADRLADQIRDAWPNYAIGVARTCAAGCDQTGLVRRAHPERPWVLKGLEPPGGPAERPPWPEDLEISYPVKRHEIPILRKHLQGEVAYYRGAAPQIRAELDALAPETSFGRVATVTGVVHPMPADAFETYKEMADLKFDIYFYLREGEDLPTAGLIGVPAGALMVLLMSAMMVFWTVSKGRGYESVLEDEG